MQTSPLKIVSGLENGQVLQRLGKRGATAVIKGEGSGDGPVVVRLSKGNAPLRGWAKKSAGKLSRGKFEINLAGIPVGGPYRLRLEAGGQRVEVASFFVGDVWILAGQSNMQGCGDMTGPAKPHPLIRAYSMRREWRLATEPLHILDESPDKSHALEQCRREVGEDMRKKSTKGVGAGLFFAREMLRRSGGVPQGLICTAHGGTSMTQWSPAQKHLRGDSLYGSMLLSARATGQPVAGLLWYQGESDTNPTDAEVYVARMKQLVGATRRDLRQPQLPWVIVQLGRFFTDNVNGRAWNSIQEEQRLLPDKIKFLETVPAIDLPLDDAIHIGAQGFPELGLRLASAADRLVYGNRDEALMPRLRNVNVIDRPTIQAIEVSFDSVPGGLRASGEPTGFSVVSPEGKPLDSIYKIELLGATAKLHLGAKPLEGASLNYGYGTSTFCNITDGRGFSLPVLGPISLSNSKPRAFLPFLAQWEATDVVDLKKPLNRISLAEFENLPRTVKTFGADGFINEHIVWQGRSGQAFFRAHLHLSEPMQLGFLMGYDGPFRLWLDNKPLHTDMKGTNPCYADEAEKGAALTEGKHVLHVGMDLNDGQAWGFFLRLVRKDVPREKVRLGEYTKPTYSI